MNQLNGKQIFEKRKKTKFKIEWIIVKIFEKKKTKRGNSALNAISK